MKKFSENWYEFRAWHKGVGAWMCTSVVAANVDEAYIKAHVQLHNEPGVNADDLELNGSTALQLWEGMYLTPEHESRIHTIQAFSLDEAYIALNRLVQDANEEAVSIFIDHIEEVK